MQSLGIKPYHKGLEDLGRGGYAWLQPDGNWSWSNARPITDGERAHESQYTMTALIGRAPEMGDLGEFFRYCFGAFHFEEETETPPRRTFERTLDPSVGDKRIHLKRVVPAPRRRDTSTSDTTVLLGLMAKLHRSSCC